LKKEEDERSAQHCIVCWVMRRWKMKKWRMKKWRMNDGTLIPTLAAMVVLVDRTEVEKALAALRLTVFT
jgi:hypothetical protein